MEGVEILKIILGGVENLKIIYQLFMVRIDGKRLCMNKKGSKSSKNVILYEKIRFF